MSQYKRTLDELKKNAILHWPIEILSEASELSVLPLLLQTQDKFISVLNIADKEPLAWAKVIENSELLSKSLFLKHLMVLSDVGGEALNKISPIENYIPNCIMNFPWGKEVFSYTFENIFGGCTLTNSALKVDAKNLIHPSAASSKVTDVIMLLMFGSQLENDSLPSEIKERCVVGEYLGKTDKLAEFIKKRYIFVSKLVSGAQANALGHIAQKYVHNILSQHLGAGWDVKIDGTIPGVQHNNEGEGTNFDIVVCSPTRQYVGIEVSFQVTTNSTIERKAREAESVYNSAHAQGHKICYVIDGAGNINIRQNAVKTLCQYSDCTVCMTEDEIILLAEYCQSIAV